IAGAQDPRARGGAPAPRRRLLRRVAPGAVRQRVRARGGRGEHDARTRGLGARALVRAATDRRGLRPSRSGRVRGALHPRWRWVPTATLDATSPASAEAEAGLEAERRSVGAGQRIVAVDDLDLAAVVALLRGA